MKRSSLGRLVVVWAAVFFFYARSAYAAWTPLLTSDMFTGITADVLTYATGVITISIILLAVGILIHR